MSRVSFLLALVLWGGCGQAVFTPACEHPEPGAVAGPVALLPWRDGAVALHADPRERFCAGFLTWHGSVTAPPPLELYAAAGGEGAFLGAALLEDRLWTVGRRYRTLIAVDLAAWRVVRAEPTELDRVLPVDGDRMLGWIPGNPGSLVLLDAQGGELARAAWPYGAPVAATMVAEGLLILPERTPWLARFDKGLQYQGQVQLFGLDAAGVVDLRGLVAARGALWLSDRISGALFALATTDLTLRVVRLLGHRLEALAGGSALWVVEAGGGLWVGPEPWRLAVAGLARPVAVAPVTAGAWVADFGADRILWVTRP